MPEQQRVVQEMPTKLPSKEQGKLSELLEKTKDIPVRGSIESSTEYQDMSSNDQLSMDAIATAAEMDQSTSMAQAPSTSPTQPTSTGPDAIPSGVPVMMRPHPPGSFPLGQPILPHMLPPHAIPMPLPPHMPPGSAPMMFVPMQPGTVLMDASTGQPILPPPGFPMQGHPMMLPPGMMPPPLLAPSEAELRRQSNESLRFTPQSAFTVSPAYDSSDNASNSSFEEASSATGSIHSGAGSRMSYFIPLKEGDALIESAPMPTFTTLKRKKTVSKFPAHSVAGHADQGSFVSLQKNIEVYRSSAKSSNDPEIQFEFAKFCIENSNGVEDNQVREKLLEEGFNWLKKLSQNGYTEAQYYLGVAYVDDQQYERAFAQFGLAAKRLHPGACHAVAQAFETGRGCKKDSRAALQFYKKAATAGHKPSMFRLGIANLKGEITLRQSVREAIKWLKRSAAVADKEHPQALYQLHLIYETGYSQAGVFPDESYSKSVLLEAAQLEYPPALYKLGMCYEFGKLGFPMDPAALGGEEEAAFSLSGIYLTGSPSQGVEQDEEQALYWVRKAAECGLPKAQFALGFFNEKGIGMDEPNNKEAMKWYSIAAENGDEKAKEKLGPRSTPSTSSSPRRFAFFSKKKSHEKCLVM